MHIWSNLDWWSVLRYVCARFMRKVDGFVSPCLTAMPNAGVDAILAVKRFSQLGGLQLDRDIRALVAYAGELTQRPVRDKFAELTQVDLATLM